MWFFSNRSRQNEYSFDGTIPVVLKVYDLFILSSLIITGDYHGNI